MEERLPSEPILIRLLDADFLAVELDLNRCSACVNWLRPVNGEEIERGLELVSCVAAEMRTELRRTRLLLKD